MESIDSLMSQPLPAITAKPCAPPSLAACREGLASARDAVRDVLQRAERDALPHAIAQGYWLLQAQDQHVRDAATRGQGRKPRKGSKSALAQQGATAVAPADPDRPHPGGFLEWLDTVGIKTATAYRYMQAATGAGLTIGHDAEILSLITYLPSLLESDDAEKVFGVSASLLRQASYIRARIDSYGSLSALVVAGQSQLPAPVSPPSLPAAPEQLNFDHLLSWAQANREIVAMRDQLSPEHYRAAVARAYRTLCDLTGQPWAPGQEVPPEYADLDPGHFGL